MEDAFLEMVVGSDHVGSCQPLLFMPQLLVSRSTLGRQSPTDIIFWHGVSSDVLSLDCVAKLRTVSSRVAELDYLISALLELLKNTTFRLVCASARRVSPLFTFNKSALEIH